MRVIVAFLRSAEVTPETWFLSGYVAIVPLAQRAVASMALRLAGPSQGCGRPARL